MKDGSLQSGTGSLYYMEMPTFSALIKYIEKNTKCKISCVKNFISVHMKPFGRSKRFVTCKPPGYQAMHLNPTTRGRVHPLERVFPTWVIERSPCR